MNQTEITLGAIPYRVTLADGQVLFEQTCGIFGTFSRFALEKLRDINNTWGIWYLVELESSSERIPLSHLAQAYAWACENLGKNFEPMPSIITP